MVDSKKRLAKISAVSIVTFLMNCKKGWAYFQRRAFKTRVGLSPTPCLERVRRLERRRVLFRAIRRTTNPHYLDASLLVFVEITLNRIGAPDVFEQFNAAVQKLEEIQECHLVSGDFDYLLKSVPDMSAYRKLLGETLLRLPGVNDTRTYVVMEEVKQSNRLVIKTR